MAPSDKILDPDIECAPREVIRWTQSRRLVRLVAHAYSSIPFYRRKFDEAGVVPGDIRSSEDISKLPLLEERELADNYPFGMLAASRGALAVTERRLTGGGRPYILAGSPEDMRTRVRCAARALCSMGARNGDCMLLSLDGGQFIDSAVIANAAAAAGVSVIPACSGELIRIPDILRELGVDMICCTLRRARDIAELLTERGIEPASLRMRALLLCGDDWTESDRASIETTLGVKAYDMYGLSKPYGAGIAAECVMQDGLHVAEDCFLAEVVDPVTLRPLPEGQYGELVLTFLCGEVLPLIRLRTGETTRLGFFPCACGRTLARITRPSEPPRTKRDAPCDDPGLGSGFKAAALLESIFAGMEDYDGGSYGYSDGASDGVEPHEE